MPVIIKCECCQKEFETKQSQLGKKKFCSRECKHNHGRVEITCLNCGKKTLKIGYRSDALFCDRQCKTEYSSIQHTCKKCGNKFTRGKSYKGSAEFCSIECRRTEGCQGTKNCENCGKEFQWRRGKNQVEPRFCSIKCRGHTGFKPGGELRIADLTNEQKIERLKMSFDKNVIKKEGCWDWSGSVDKGGYAIMSCRKSCGAEKGHRASYIIHKGPIPNGLHVCHTCDNRICTNPEHLWLGTHQQNNTDKILKGRANWVPPPIKRGSKNGASKLNEDQVKEIRKLLKTGMSHVEIGAKFGVSKGPIGKINRGTHWKHVKEEND